MEKFELEVQQMQELVTMALEASDPALFASIVDSIFILVGDADANLRTQYSQVITPQIQEKLLQKGRELFAPIGEKIWNITVALTPKLTLVPELNSDAIYSQAIKSMQDWVEEALNTTDPLVFAEKMTAISDAVTHSENMHHGPYGEADPMRGDRLRTRYRQILTLKTRRKLTQRAKELNVDIFKEIANLRLTFYLDILEEPGRRLASLAHLFREN